ncbi:phenylacetate--CoA ligase family protein [Aurantimonas sp. Leaf443]|uniref:phenylacetate--CoA ligase family protein n=1 Tax=Aurantimonas sp. Leaf443 TaxID=1736378 RepID=UPI001FCD5E40|nr:phenylacetate--CoA ligase family protein [Aurantimonas sp. Leaf443]
MIAATIAYRVAERMEKRDVRSKIRTARTEIDRPAPERRARAGAALAETVAMAGARVPYYRDLFASIGFDPAKIARDPAYLGDLPYLTKDIIREQGDRLLREDREGLRIHVAKTGGSTGPSAHIHYDQEAADWSSAITQECRRRVGNTHWRSELHFASKFPEVFPFRDRLREAMKCFAMNRDNIFFATFSAEELESIWRQIRRLHPHLVHSHPSTMDQLAAHVERTRGSQKAFAIFESSGELLEDRQRERIARALRCVVVDRYGLAEAGVVAYQLDPARAEKRFLEFFAWPEIMPGAADGLGDAGADEQAGELVITPLKNSLMPLLRYRTGDNAVLARRADGLFISRMVGRIHDVITLNGTPMPTHYIQDVLDRVGGVREFQIEMRAGRPVFRIVPEEGADPASVATRIASWWGDAVAVEFIALSDLKLVGARQKFRHLVETEQSGAEPA